MTRLDVGCLCGGWGNIQRASPFLIIGAGAAGLCAALAASQKLSHVEALQKSMLTMIGDAQHPQWAEPKFWAAFVVVGEPRKPAK